MRLLPVPLALPVAAVARAEDAAAPTLHGPSAPHRKTARRYSADLLISSFVCARARVVVWRLCAAIIVGRQVHGIRHSQRRCSHVIG